MDLNLEHVRRVVLGKTRYGLPEWTAILIELCSRRATAGAAVKNLGASKRMPPGDVP